MKKVIRLTESDLIRLVKRTIKETEQEAMMSTIESDPQLSRKFDKIVDYLSNLDPEQQAEVESIAQGGDEMSQEFTEAKRTVYKDYGPDRGPVEISKSEFMKRKLMSVLPASIVGAIMGIAMAGGMSADDVLQMALGTAAVTGGIGAGLISTVGREKVDVPDEEETDMEEKPMSESYRRKRVVRLTESDLARIVKRVIEENEEEYLYHDPSSMGSGKWYKNTFMNQGEPEEYLDDELDIEDISTDDVGPNVFGDNVFGDRYKKFYSKNSPTIKRAKLRKQ